MLSRIRALVDIPSLKSYPIIGHTYLFLPGGKYKADRLTEAIFDISKQLGSIFRLNLGGYKMVVSVNADHARDLYKNEGIRPIRPPFLALAYYRQKTFNSAGIVPGNGEEWYKFRNGINCLLKPQLVKKYERKHQEVAKSFLHYLNKCKGHDHVVDDVFHHLLKYTIEAISVLCPGHRFDCLSQENEGANEIIEASIEFMNGLYDTLKEPPIWKFYKTKGYKKLESSHDTIYRILRTHFEDMNTQFKNDPTLLKEEQPFMFHLLDNKNLSDEDKLMLTMEIFIAGIDATATTIAFTLYHLSHDTELQQLAREDSYTLERRFLKACVKETLRLNPTAGGNSRIMPKDVQIGNYSVMKDTLVNVCSSVTSLDEQYFKDAHKYFPKRWMRSENREYHKFASLPFGHGPRMCPGKRVAEQEIVILLAEILKHYTLEYAGEKDVGMVYRMNRVPDSPIKIRFTNIK